jgi:hypothetical protein
LEHAQEHAAGRRCGQCSAFKAKIVRLRPTMRPGRKNELTGDLFGRENNERAGGRPH